MCKLEEPNTPDPKWIRLLFLQLLQLVARGSRPETFACAEKGDSFIFKKDHKDEQF